MANSISSISITFVLNAFFLLLCPLCSWKEGYVVEGNETTKTYLHSDLQVNSLLPLDICNQSSQAASSSSQLKVMHRYGPCVGVNQGKAAGNAPSNMEILLRDQHRVDLIRARLSGHGIFKEMKKTLPVQPDAYAADYVVAVGLGTPKKDFSLIFDTGSDLTWTQCEPCAGSCYEQEGPIFNPAKSTSYKNVSCSSAFCNLVSSGNYSEKFLDSGILIRKKDIYFPVMSAEVEQDCSASTCIYQIQYGDTSFSIGFFATETLTITSSDVFKNFAFGCGQDNEGLYGGAAGLLGLGRSKLSLTSQTASKYKKLFSYCIPSTSSSNGYLNFGGKISKKAKFTPLSKSFDDTPFYGLDITGFSVGGRKLSIHQSIGTIIDSGTVITRLPPTAYSAISSEFRKFMKDYTLIDGYSIFDTCYDFSEHDTIRIPKISVFLKGGVEMAIDASGVLYPVDGVKRVCLAFAGNDDLAILGNFQQKTFDVVYDGAKGRVGFTPGGCR